MNHLPKIIVIVGPTASGKTGLGIEIAKQVNGEIISVDSRQVYRGMDIGTAKVMEDQQSDFEQDRKNSVPTLQEEKTIVSPESVEGLRSIHELFNEKPIIVEGIPHWGMNLVNPDEEYSVADFKTYKEKKIQEILQRTYVPILVGGTGLWITAIIDNFDLTQTPGDDTLRQELQTRSLGDLFAEYKRLDPEGAEVIDRENKRRVIRALEVTKLTGKPFFQQQRKGTLNYDVLQIGLLVERELLHERINERVDAMVAAGLVNEVRRLKETYGCELDAMTGIGYRQICEFLAGHFSLADAIDETKKATRQYAKRQMTWLKRDQRIHWLSDPTEACALVKNFLKKT